MRWNVLYVWMGAAMLVALTGCTTTNTGQVREQVRESTATLDSVRHELSRDASGLRMTLTETVTVTVALQAVHERRRRGAFASSMDEMGPMAIVYAPITLAADVVTLGQMESTVNRTESIGTERRRMQRPAADGAQVNGLLRVTDGMTGRSVIERSVSMRVRDGAVALPLPAGAGNCLRIDFQGELQAHGGAAPLRVDESIGC